MIGPRDLDILRSTGPALSQALPTVLATMHARGEAGASLTAAVRNPIVKALRAAYWACITTGQLDEEFASVARRLGCSYCEHNVPTQPLTIGHSTTMMAILTERGPIETIGRGRSLFRRKWLRDAYRQRVRYSAAFSKATWLGLSMVLDGYGAAEAARRDQAVDQLEQSFNRRIGDALDAMTNESQQLDVAVKSMSDSAIRSAENADTVAGAAAHASGTVSLVAAAAAATRRQRDRCLEPCLPLRQAGQQGGRHGAADRRRGEGLGRQCAQGWRRGEADQQHCRPDQFAGPKCND